MTICKTAYQTTACKDYLMKKTDDAIEQAQINGQLHFVEGAKGLYEVHGGNTIADVIPAFAHPVTHGDDENVRIISDMRHYGKWDQHQQVFRVRNQIDYAFNQLRAKLNYVFVENAPTILRDISPMPMVVFSTLISEAISRRFALDPQEQMGLAVLSAIWYNSQFTDATEFTERERMALVNMVSRTMRLPADFVLTTIENVGVVQNIQHFCDLAREVTQSVRLAELNTGLLFAILGGSFGRNDWREMMAVALEHPPTWIALVAAAVTERTYKHTVVTKITERGSLRNEGGNFVRAVTKMADTLTTH